MNQDSARLDSAALAELQTLRPGLLRQLPLPTVLTVRLPGEVEAGFIVVGDTREVGKLGRIGLASFASDEVEALAYAVEYGRADAVDLVAWIARKRAEPSFRLDLSTALQGVPAPDPVTSPLLWTLGRVLRELRAVVVDGQLIEPAAAELPLAA